MSGLLHTQKECAISDTLSLEGKGGGIFLSFCTAAKTVTNMVFVLTVVLHLLRHFREKLSLIHDTLSTQLLAPFY